MATNNTSAKLPPAHDFAPSWLKIPSYCEEPYGKTEVKTNYQRDDNTLSSHYISSNQDSSSLSNFKRERLGTNCERKNNYHSSRHNSLDYDDSTKPILLSNGSSHLRRPHSRHDFRDNPYNKLNCSDHVDSKNRAKLCNGSDIINSDNFNQEFPLLQGDNVEEPKSSFISSPTGGVWEKSRSGQVLGSNPAWKVQLIKRPENLDNQNTSSAFYSTLSSTANLNLTNNNHHQTSAKTVFHRNSTKATTLKTMSTSKSNRAGDIIKLNAKDGTLNGFSRVPPPPSVPVPNAVAKKSSTTPPPTLHIMVKTPKCRTNKNEFLKSLRTEKKVKEMQEDVEPEKVEKSMEDETTNTTASTTTTTTTSTATSLSTAETTTTIHCTSPVYVDKEQNQEIPILSSSLEAEQRLLRQMGWKDDGSDDETYAPLTEDELKEIGYLKEKLMVSERPRINGPRKLPKSTPLNVNTSPTSNTESWSHDSSSSDSDFSDDSS